MPASRSSIAPNTLGESTRGRHIHSIAPLGATSATASQSDRNAYSAIGGNELVPSRADGSRSRAGTAGADLGAGRPSASASRLAAASRKRVSIAPAGKKSQLRWKPLSAQDCGAIASVLRISGFLVWLAARRASAGESAEHGERIAGPLVPHCPEVELHGDLDPGGHFAAQALGQLLGALLVGGPDEHIAPAVHVGDPFLLEPVRQLAGLCARAALDPHLELGVALLR